MLKKNTDQKRHTHADFPALGKQFKLYNGLRKDFILRNAL